jgi:hypothetical protein
MIVHPTILARQKILVSGLWGVLWYYEIRGTYTIRCWFLSAMIAILGVVCLSRERLLAGDTDDGDSER